MMKSYDIDTLYQKYKSLNKRQRVRLLSRLQAQGIAIVRIQPYAYSEASGIKHLFFYFEGSREAVPYFLLESSVWQAVQRELMKIE
jgi:hypothetical protein